MREHNKKEVATLISKLSYLISEAEKIETKKKFCL